MPPNRNQDHRDRSRSHIQRRAEGVRVQAALRTTRLSVVDVVNALATRTRLTRRLGVDGRRHTALAAAVGAPAPTTSAPNTSARMSIIRSRHSRTLAVSALDLATLNSPAAYLRADRSTGWRRDLSFVGRIRSIRRYAFMLDFSDRQTMAVLIRQGADLRDDERFNQLREGDLVLLRHERNDCIAFNRQSRLQHFDSRTTFEQVSNVNARLDRSLYPSPTPSIASIGPSRTVRFRTDDAATAPGSSLERALTLSPSPSPPAGSTALVHHSDGDVQSRTRQAPTASGSSTIRSASTVRVHPRASSTSSNATDAKFRKACEQASFYGSDDESDAAFRLACEQATFHGSDT